VWHVTHARTQWSIQRPSQRSWVNNGRCNGSGSSGLVPHLAPVNRMIERTYQRCGLHATLSHVYSSLLHHTVCLVHMYTASTARSVSNAVSVHIPQVPCTEWYHTPMCIVGQALCELSQNQQLLAETFHLAAHSLASNLCATLPCCDTPALHLSAGVGENARAAH
jgi:hypothetical protein